MFFHIRRYNQILVSVLEVDRCILCPSVSLFRSVFSFLSAEISVSLLSVIVTFCGIVLLSVSLFVSWKLCWLPWRDKEGGGLSLTSGLLPGTAGLGGAAGPSLLPPLLQRKEGHSSSSLYPSLGQQGHPHFSDLVGLERGEGGGVPGGPNETQEHSYLDMDSYPNSAGEKCPSCPNLCLLLPKSEQLQPYFLCPHL